MITNSNIMIRLSWGIRIGPFTRNFTRGSTSIDTPGPGGLYSAGRRKRRDTAG